MNDDILARLAEVELPTRAPALESIERRARAIRRGRHGRRFGLVTVAVATLVLGGVTLPIGDDGSGQNPTARGAAVYLGVLPATAADGGAPSQCPEEQTTQWIDRADWAKNPGMAASAELLTNAPYPLVGLGVSQSTLTCLQAIPAAVLFDEDPVRGISVWPDVYNPYQGDKGIESRDVRGTKGLLLDRGGSEYSSLVISWNEPDGKRWLAEGSGVSVEEFTATLDGLTFTNGQLDPATVPAGFTSLPLEAPVIGEVSWTWDVFYGNENLEGVEPSEFVRFGATTSYRAEPREIYASRAASSVQFTTVAGERAVYGTNGATNGWGTLYWQHDGISYSLFGTNGMAELIPLAEQAEHVGIDDARLTEAPKYPADKSNPKLRFLDGY